MAENTNYQPNQENIRDLLSPYLDGEVNDEELALVEQAITDSPELEQELESLRQTVALVAALPPMPAPRPFTLSEADIQPVATPAPRKRFWLPAWAGGLAMAAAALICVLAAGSLFFGSQFGSNSAPVLGIARVDEAAQAVESAEMAPAEPAAEVAIEETREDEQEEAAAEETFAAEESEEAAADTAVEEKTVTIETEAEKSVVEKETDDTTALAGQAEATEGEETNGGEMRDADQTGAGAAPLPTPSPLPTTTATPVILLPIIPTSTAAPSAPDSGGGEGTLAGQAAPAEEPVSETAAEAGEAEAQAPLAQPAPGADGEAASEEAASETSRDEAESEALEAPAAAQPTISLEDTIQNDQEFALRQESARPVEIQDLRLQVQPGFIQIEGIIEAEPGTILGALLLRNQSPFEGWADSAGLQSVVQSDGRFSLSIKAQTNRVDQDLFVSEPATYEIVILSTGTAAPIVATVSFDTFELGANQAQPSATATPTEEPIPTDTAVPPIASSTPLPQPTVMPPEQPAETALQAIATPQPESRSQRITILILSTAGLIGLAILAIIGVFIWSTINKKR